MAKSKTGRSIEGVGQKPDTQKPARITSVRASKGKPPLTAKPKPTTSKKK